MRKTRIQLKLASLGIGCLLASAIAIATDFAAPASYPVGKSPSTILIGDFNGDARPDLAVGNAGSNDVSILLNNGDGTFKAAVNSSAGTSPQNMVSGDFNGDGKLDLVVINSGVISSSGTSTPGAVLFLLGNGDATFQAPVAITADTFPVSIAVADFNEDKKLDLLVGDNGGGGLTLLLGKGDGTFQPGTQIFGGSVTAVLTGDFNGDKHLDVVVGARSHTFNSKLTALALSLLAGNGDGTFQPPATIDTVGSPSLPSSASSWTVSSPQLVSGDFNGGGKLDLLLRYVEIVLGNCIPLFCEPQPVVHVVRYLGNGDGTFGPPLGVAASEGNAGGVSVAEFNADGKPDFAFAAFGLGTLHLGHGDGSFLALPPLTGPPTGIGPLVAAADLNGDILPDIAVTDLTNNAVVVFLNHSPTSGADLNLRLAGTIGGPGVTQGEGTGTEIIWDVVVGGEIDYSVTILNEGPHDATGVLLTESLPSGLKFISVQPSQGTCSGTTTITCDLGTMTDVSTATVNFAITATAAGTLTDALHISAATLDANSKNDSASFTMKAVLPADLVASESSSANSVVAGTQVTYTIKIKNNGPAQATNVVLSDALPAGATIAAIQARQGSCAPPANGSMSCELGTLAVSSTATVSFGATLSAAGTMTNAVGVSGSEPDTDGSNNGASLDVTVTAPPDFSISPATSNLTLQRGASASVVLSFPAQGGFAGNIALTCAVTGPSPAPTCGISPASVTPGNTATLTVTAPNLAATLAPFQTSGQFSAAAWPLWLSLSVFGLVLAKKSAKESGHWWLPCVLIAAILPAACGGGSSGPPPPQNFTVTITAAANAGAMQHTTQISVTVQ